MAKKCQILDMATWVQVYSIYKLVLSSHHPSSTSEIIAYQLLIVQHSKKFEYPSWSQYDIEFHQWGDCQPIHQICHINHKHATHLWRHAGPPNSPTFGTGSTPGNKPACMEQTASSFTNMFAAKVDTLLHPAPTSTPNTSQPMNYSNPASTT